MLRPLAANPNLEHCAMPGQVSREGGAGYAIFAFLVIGSRGAFNGKKTDRRP